MPLVVTRRVPFAPRSVRVKYGHRVSRFIAISRAVKQAMTAGGIDGSRISVVHSGIATRPDPVTPRDWRAELRWDSDTVIAGVVGAMTAEKGIDLLADAWRQLSGIPLTVVGEGPLANTVWPSGVTRLGRQSREDFHNLMKNAYILVVPSIWYEGAPGVIMEAFASGVPVIASDLGSMPELVTSHQTGLLFKGGDAADLVTKVRWAFEHPQELAPMRMAARREYESKHSAPKNYQMLVGIYQRAMESARSRP